MEDLDKVKEFILDKLKEIYPEKENTKSKHGGSVVFKECLSWLNAYRCVIPDDFTVLDQLMPYIERSEPLTILEGMEGTGKSTLVAQLGLTYKESDRHIFPYAQYVSSH